MRRIYESDALRRDDEDPFTPNESSEGDRSHVDWGNLSHAFMPRALRPLAIAVSVETDRDRYGPDDPVRFRVRFRNRLPFPVALVTAPVRWTWWVDGIREGSELPAEVPDERRRFQFDRGETKTFYRRWNQRIRETEQEWRRAPAGTHTLSVGVTTRTETDRLAAETEFRLDGA